MFFAFVLFICHHSVPRPLRLAVASVNHDITAPTYRPSPEQFAEPIQYIEFIKMHASVYGICCVQPPQEWNVKYLSSLFLTETTYLCNVLCLVSMSYFQPECVISTHQRFCTEVQHVHRMRHRFSSTTQTLECMRRHHANHNESRFEVPALFGIELDLPALSNAVAKLGGTSALGNDFKAWQKVLEALNLPKERVRKVFDAYTTHVLAYDSLSEKEKQRLLEQVSSDESQGRLDLTCVCAGKWKSLDEFFTAAQHVHKRFELPSDVTPDDVESRYFSLVNGGESQVSVLSACVDTSNCGGGFPKNASSPYAKHGWNFNQLQRNPASILNVLGDVSGVTTPELHIRMLFSTACWSSDPHGLPFISYLHTGSDIIWFESQTAMSGTAILNV